MIRREWDARRQRFYYVDDLMSNTVKDVLLTPPELKERIAYLEKKIGCQCPSWEPSGCYIHDSNCPAK